MGHPYVRDYMLKSDQTWVLCMSPLMAKLLSESEFIEVDVTYRASVELEYLLNVVTFNYTTLKCEFTMYIFRHLATNLEMTTLFFIYMYIQATDTFQFFSLSQGMWWQGFVLRPSQRRPMLYALRQYSQQ